MSPISSPPERATKEVASAGRYIPALAYRWLTPLYDPVVAITTRERTFKAALLQQASLQAGERVLDLACGTATLTIAAKRSAPTCVVTGVDGDNAILAIARAKAEKAGVQLSLNQALSDRLPYADGAFDVVMSSLFFHHLTRAAKLATLRETRRVLKPGGELHVADWGKASNPVMRSLFLFIQMLDGFETTADNVNGLLPQLMKEAGFEQTSERRRFATPLGTISLYGAFKPA